MQKKIALITGASRGIGRAVAEYLAKRDYHVILVARNQTKLMEVSEHIRQQGCSATHHALNITNVDHVQTCIENIITLHGRIDVLFNNAGIALLGTTEISDHEIENVIQVNLLGAIFFAKYVALQMKKQQHGYIINLSSLSGKISSSTLGIYNASKFGLAGFSEALAKEMGAFGVKVTAICPSMIATEMTAEFNFEQERMIHVDYICKTVGYLLDLGPNALLTEVMIHCAPFLLKMVKAEEQIFAVDV